MAAEIGRRLNGAGHLCVFQEEFPNIERHLIVLDVWMTVCEFNEIRGCFQSPKLLSPIDADLNQIRKDTSAGDRFRDLFSASQSPTAPDDEMA
jgi:hypothetical protein